jgi:P-type Cu+ transporter
MNEHPHARIDDHHDEHGDAVCPVCRMRVNSATAPSRVYEGKTYYFCEQSCLRAFDQSPAKYAA